MWTGHLLSCFLSRQMEFDADLHEIRLVGSETFTATQKAFPELHAAADDALNELARLSSLGTLVVNYPMLIGHCQERISPDALAEIGVGRDTEKAHLWDTHPTDRARIAHAKKANEPGVFHGTSPAHTIFRDFSALSERFTCRWLEQRFGLSLAGFRTLSFEDYQRESKEHEERLQRGQAYFGSALSVLNPIALAESSLPWDGRAGNELRRLIGTWPDEVEPLIAAEVCREHDDMRRSVDELQSQAILLKTSHANASPRYGAIAVQNKTAALAALENDISEMDTKLKAAEIRYRRIRGLFEERMALAYRALLCLSGREERAPLLKDKQNLKGNVPSFAELLNRCGELQPMLKVLCAQCPTLLHIHKLRIGLEGAFTAVFGQSLSKDDIWELERVGFEIEKALVSLRKEMKALPYPFPTPNQNATVAETIIGEIPDGDDIGQIHAKASAVEELFFRAYFEGMYELASALSLAERKVLESPES